MALCCFPAEAQYRQRYKLYEFHGGIGTANIFGDLGGAATKDNMWGLKDIQFSQTRPTFYVAGQTDLNENFSSKVNLFAGMTAGNDKGSFRDYRGYSYSGWIFELTGQFEWNYWTADKAIGHYFAHKRGLRGARMQTRAYLFLGAGLVYANSSLNTYERKLGRGEYSKKNAFGLAIPYGLGIKSDIDGNWAVGFEIGRRYCTSDYLDGITTDWSKANDLYYFTTLHAIYKIQIVGGKRKVSLRPSSKRRR